MLTHTLSIYRPDEDIEMQVCESYSLQTIDDEGRQVPTDNCIYENI